jgi:malate dehydrogenase
MEDAAKGLQAELHDSAFHLLNKTVVTSNMSVAFRESDFIFLAGSRLREPVMRTRKELLLENCSVYRDLAKAINDNAKRDCLTLVMGNPPNINCLICCHNASGISKQNFAALSRLEHNRAVGLLAHMIGSPISSVS